MTQSSLLWVIVIAWFILQRSPESHRTPYSFSSMLNRKFFPVYNISIPPSRMPPLYRSNFLDHCGPEPGCWSQLLECTLFCFCFLDLLLEWPDRSLTSVGQFWAFTFTNTSCDSIVLSSKLACLEVFLLVYINLLEIYPFLPGFSFPVICLHVISVIEMINYFAQSIYICSFPWQWKDSL